jgi:hypothetical protein
MHASIKMGLLSSCPKEGCSEYLGFTQVPFTPVSSSRQAQPLCTPVGAVFAFRCWCWSSLGCSLPDCVVALVGKVKGKEDWYAQMSHEPRQGATLVRSPNLPIFYLIFINTNNTTTTVTAINSPFFLVPA